MIPLSHQTTPQLLGVLLLLLVSLTLRVCSGVPDGWDFPTEITLRAGVLHAPPFAILEEQYDGTIKYSGFQPDLLERLKIFAKEDGVTLNFELAPSPPNFNPALDLVANDCNTTKNPNPLEDCQKFDVIVANYYATPARCTRVALSPPWLKSTITTLKYLDKPEGATDYTTLKQAEDAGAPICVKGGTFFATVVKARFPKGNYVDCPTLEECIATLKRGECVLSAEDELMSRYSQAWDVSLEVTREQFNTQYKVWPFSYALPFETRLLMEKWLRDANTNATLDELYSKYFQKSLCPVGTAGENCDQPCDPIHGTSNKRGVCVCESTKWTGDDCSIEVEEELNLIPTYMIIIAYSMLGINVFVILVCAVWLFWQRNSAQVRVSQPFFLGLVLLGCLISSSTIVVLSQEDEGDGPVPACMAIPWLYSIGFSITFGTLFAKIRRVYLIFKNAAANQAGNGHNSRSNAITAEETLGIIGVVLFVDCVILITWTIMDPLRWERYVISADQFGAPLESEGRCVSDNWLAYGGALALLHLLLLGTACYLCYIARDIPTRFSEGKYVSIAMISNLQIFIVGVPILIIIGTEPATSFFVRCTIIWMNDLAVVVLLFGNLMYTAHFKPEAKKDEVKNAVARIAQREQTRYHGRGSHLHTNDSVMSPAVHASSGCMMASVDQQSLVGSHHKPRSVKFIDDTITEKAGAESEPPLPPIKKPVDVLKNSRNSSSIGGSWGGANLSAWVSSHQPEDASTVSEFDDEGSTIPETDNSNNSSNKKKPDNSNDSNCNISLDKDERSEESPPPQQRISYELRPANLPKNKPNHMSYAAHRISRVRGQHAQYIADRKTKSGSSSSGEFKKNGGNSSSTLGGGKK